MVIAGPYFPTPFPFLRPIVDQHAPAQAEIRDEPRRLDFPAGNDHVDGFGIAERFKESFIGAVRDRSRAPLRGKDLTPEASALCHLQASIEAPFSGMKSVANQTLAVFPPTTTAWILFGLAKGLIGVSPGSFFQVA